MEKVQEENKKKPNAAQTLGAIVIAFGFIGAIGLLMTFDFETYSHYKLLSSYEDEFLYMKSELISTWISAIVSAVGGLIAGVALMTLGNIQDYLKSMASR